MNREEFIKTYIYLVKTVIRLNKVVIRNGHSALECEVEDIENNISSFKKGLYLIIDGVAPSIIDEKYTNYVRLSKDNYDRQLKEIIKRALLGIQKMERTSILIIALNSYANLSSEEENQIENLLVYESVPVMEAESNEGSNMQSSEGFSDIILSLNNEAIHRLFRELDSKDLAMSLKNQKNTVREKIFKNLSKRASFQLEEEIDYMNPETDKIIDAQIRIIDLLTKLLEAGEIEA